MTVRESLLCAAIFAATGFGTGSAHADGVSANPADVMRYTGMLSTAAEGRRVYLKLNCAGCHGDRGAGSIGPNVQTTEQGDINEKVTYGSDGMPAFGAYLGAADLIKLGAYLHSINTSSEPRFQNWWEAQPSR